MDIIIIDDPNLGPATLKVLGEIRADVAELAKDWAKLAADVKDIQNMDAIRMSGKHLALARDLPSRRLELMRRELSLRVGLRDQYYPARRADRMAAYDAALAKSAQVRSEVREKLRSIGYVESKLIDGGADSITDEMICRHPAVFAARLDEAAAEARRDAITDEQHNIKAMAELQASFEALKRRALSAVA